MIKLTEATENKPVEIIDGRFVVLFRAEPEYMDPRKHFVVQSGWSQEEYLKLKNTRWFSVTIEVWKDAEKLGEQSLGGCAYKKLDDFWKEGRKDYYADMVEAILVEAGFCEEAKRWKESVGESPCFCGNPDDATKVHFTHHCHTTGAKV